MNYYLPPAPSRNSKTGPIYVSTQAKGTCWTGCAYYGGKGCYAENGPVGMHWAKVTDGSRGGSFDEFITAVEAMPADAIWRYGQAGDLPGKDGAIDRRKLKRLVRANRRRRSIAYTHKPVLDNVAHQIAIWEANRDGFTINLSGNNLAHADELAALDIAPVVVVLPYGTTSNTRTPAGRKVVVCPATQRDDVTCKSCMLCARQRDFIIGFPAHGVSAKRADAIARA